MKKDRNFFEKEKIVVPFFRPYINSDDRNYVQKSLRSHILTNGPIIKDFENKFARYTNAPYSIAVSSATSALHLALRVQA